MYEVWELIALNPFHMYVFMYFLLHFAALDCGPPPSIQNGFYEIVVDYYTTVFPILAVYYCDSRFDISSYREDHIHCLLNGTWGIHDLPSCESEPLDIVIKDASIPQGTNSICLYVHYRLCSTYILHDEV